MNDIIEYPVKKDIAGNAHIDAPTYQRMYQASIQDPASFWREQAKIIDWMTPFTQVKNTSFTPNNININWFADGTLNVSANCIDRHLAKHGDEPALLWEGDDPNQSRAMTYRELHQEVCKFANGLKSQGVKKGDVICIYMPMVMEAVVAMLACTRIGAIHTVVFGGFSPEALAGRILDSNAKLIVTADEAVRGGRQIALKQNVDMALADPRIATVTSVIVYQRTGNKIDWNRLRDHWWHDIMAAASSQCEPEAMNAEDPLFILYTSGSTGKPKGVLHTTGGYLVYTALTFKCIFDYQPKEVFWCTADIGWITGHSYMVYGPLANGATTLLFEGVPSSAQNPARLSEIIDKHQVNILYTAPTAIRALMAKGDAVVKNTRRSSLRIMGSVGEPINPKAWQWYFDTIGNGKCPIVDTWWQTETGGVLITPLIGAMPLKAGSACLPFFGVQPALVDNEGNILTGSAEGNLVMLDSWPGQMRTVYGDHTRFEQVYFSAFKNMYFTGDGAKRDDDGYYWITGRVDDVLNISGVRMGTAEVESALVSFEKIAEAAIVGIPHDIKGQAIYAYVTLNAGEIPSDELAKQVKKWVKRQIGAVAMPEVIHWAPALPKTRSGKIMRRILRKIAVGDTNELGDTSTLADPDVVQQLIQDKTIDRKSVV